MTGTLNRWDRQSNIWQVYRNDPRSKQHLQRIGDGHPGRPGRHALVGTFFGGLKPLRSQDRSLHNLHDLKSQRSPQPERLTLSRSLYRDSNGVLWVGGWNNGLSRFDRVTKPSSVTCLTLASRTA